MPVSVGSYLKRMREERNLTIDQVAQATRVRPIYLKALENDEPSVLPSKPQARGFIRLVADYLQIDPQPLLDVWPDQLLAVPDFEDEFDALLIEESSRNEQTETKSSADLHDQLEEPANETAEEPVEINAPSKKPQVKDSRTIFKQIGQDLRSQREKLNLSVEDVERFTRLRAHHIKALELGRFEDLPSLVQGRGMLSNYASFLDLDSEAILMRFTDGLQTRRIERTSTAAETRQVPSTTKTKKEPGKQAAWRRLLTPDLLIGGSLFILLIGFIIWGAARIVDLQRQESLPTAVSISEILMSTEEEESLSEMLTLTAEIPTVASNGLGGPLPLPEGGENLEEQEEPLEPLPVNDDPIQVYIIANQRVWMQVVVDDRVAFEGRVVPGNAYPFSGNQQIELVTGNGAGIQVIFNQTNLGALGVSGEVVRMIFTEEGTLVPTPLFTLTPIPTATPSPTPTPTPTVATPTITPFVP